MAICCGLSDYQKQHRFPLCYPCRNSSPVRASRISEGFKRPRFTRHNRERSAKLCANFVYCSTRWQSTQVGTGRNQRFTISLAQSNHQRMVGDSYSKRIKAARQPARCCRRRGKDKGDRTWPAGKMVSRCASVSMVSSI